MHGIPMVDMRYERNQLGLLTLCNSDEMASFFFIPVSRAPKTDNDEYGSYRINDGENAHTHITSNP